METGAEGQIEGGTVIERKRVRERGRDRERGGNLCVCAGIYPRSTTMDHCDGGK